MGDHKTRVYRKGVLEAEGFPVRRRLVSSWSQPDTVVWVDFCGPSKEQLHELAAELGLHELAVEDAVGPHQRPKLDRYATHLFLSCHAVRVDVDGGFLDETEIDAFINERWLITVRKNEGFPIGSGARALGSFPDLASFGVSFLLYGLLDVIVDSYFDAVQAFDEYYEEVSDGIFADVRSIPRSNGTGSTCVEPWCASTVSWFPCGKRSAALMRREHSAVSEELYPYFQDVYDHILRVSESTDSLRDLVGTIVETNLSLRDYRQNQIRVRLFGVVLERDVDPGAVQRHVAVVDREVELHDLADPEVAHRSRRRFDRVLRGFLPGLRTRSDHFRDAVDAVGHRASPSFDARKSSTPNLRRFVSTRSPELAGP